MALYASIAALVVGAVACAVVPTTGAPEKIVKKAAALGLTDGQNFVYDGWDIPPTQCTVGGVTMHCCEPGRAIIGVRADFNVFKCAALAVAGGDVSLSGLARNGMLSCPPGQVAVGFHADLNLLACQTLPGVALGSEVIDGTGTMPATQDAFPMHVCPADLTMTGLNLDQNSMSCVPQQPPPPVITACSVATDSSGTTVQFSNQLTSPSLGTVTFDSTMVRGSTATLTRTFGMNGNSLYVLQSQVSSDGSFTRSETFFPPITGAANVTSTSDGQTVVYVIDGRETLPAPVGADPSTVQFADGNAAPQLNVDGAIRDAVAQLLSSAAAAPCLSQPPGAGAPSGGDLLLAPASFPHQSDTTNNLACQGCRLGVEVAAGTCFYFAATSIACGPFVFFCAVGEIAACTGTEVLGLKGCDSPDVTGACCPVGCGGEGDSHFIGGTPPPGGSVGCCLSGESCLNRKNAMCCSSGTTACGGTECCQPGDTCFTSPQPDGSTLGECCAPQNVRNGRCCFSGTCTTRADCNGGDPNGLNGCDANGCCIIG